MTGSELQRRVYARLDDDPVAPKGTTPKEVLDALNEGQELASLLTLCFETSAPITLPAASPFLNLRTLFPDFLVPLALRVGGKRLAPVTLKEIDAFSEVWQASPGAPKHYLTLGFNVLAVTPQPTADTAAQLTYARTPQPIVLDQALELDDEYQPELINYALWRLSLREGAHALDRGNGYLASFLSSMAALGDYVRSRSRVARYDVVPFELQEFLRRAAAMQKRK